MAVIKVKWMTDNTDLIVNNVDQAVIEIQSQSKFF